MDEKEKRVIDKWSQKMGNGQSLLDGVEKDQIPSFAAALEGQRLYNESCYADNIAQFKRVSIPLMRRLLHAAPNLEGSFKPCRYWHLLTTRFAFPRQDLSFHHNIDHEAEHVAVLAASMGEEIKKLGPTKIWCFSREGSDRLLINCENA